MNTGVDLVVWKNDAKGDDPPGDGAPRSIEGFDPIATNGTGTYTVIVDNVGTQDTTGIKLVDTLPAGTQLPLGHLRQRVHLLAQRRRDRRRRRRASAAT